MSTQVSTTELDTPFQQEIGLDSTPISVAAEAATPLTRHTYLKLISAGFSFFYAGTNDGSIGPLIPYFLDEYNISTGFVAIIYATIFLGWLFSAVTNTHLTSSLDLSLGAMLILGATGQLVAQLLRFWAPPFPLFTISFFLGALGTAYQDSFSNTFIATVHGAHRWLGFIYAMYALGCLVAPFVATIVASHSKWHWFYAIEVGLGVLNLALVIVAFWEGWKASRQREGSETSAVRTNRKNTQALKEIKNTLKLPGVWLLSLFFFFFLGAGITAGGWVVEYLVLVRHGDLSKMGYVPTGFYGGIFLGRLILAEPTYKLGERRMVFLYIVLCVSLQLVFWLVPSITAGAVALSVLGFFYGPLFVSGISVGTKVFPKHAHSAALGFVFVLAQAGGSIFPSITGIVAAHAGVQVLQPILLGLFVATGISWLLVPTVSKSRE